MASQPTPITAVILAAGKGTRMKSALPKVMHPVASQPMVGHVVKLALDVGATPIAMVVAEGMDSVAAVGRDIAGDVDVAIQKEQHGTAHAVLAAKPVLGEVEGILLVLYGDTPLLTKATVEQLIAAVEDDKRTVSRLAYNLRYDNFENLITLLTTAGTYKTNVADLSIAALNALLDRLAAANKATNDADKAWSNAADARNAALCSKTDSICSVVADIKMELISMETKLGATYKKVVEIKFMPFDR